MKTVTFDDERVMTLRQIAEKVAPCLGWRTFDVSPRRGTIHFTSEDGRSMQMNLAGLACAVAGGDFTLPSEADSVDIAEVLDIPHLVWGKDENDEWVGVRY